MIQMKLIAEMCQNHNGDSRLLEEMVKKARDSGATHCKIQGLYSSELTRRPEFEPEFSPPGGLVRPYSVENERLASLDLTFEDEERFIDTCIANDVIPMITTFSHAGVDRAVKAGFTSFKIAGYDCASRAMIKRLLPHANEIVISTGATAWKDVLETGNLLATGARKDTEVGFLHARTIYPTPIDLLGLLRMVALSELGFDYGLSDHSAPRESGLFGSKLSLFLGAKIIERHFTILDKSDTRDGPVSVSPDELQQIANFSSWSREEQLAELAEDIRSHPGALSIDSLNPTKEEENLAKYYRGRVASVLDGTQIFAWEEWPN